AQVHDAALPVAEELDLDVSGLGYIFFYINSIIIERRSRLGLRDAEPQPQRLLVPGDAHAAAAPARRGLDDHREADLARDPGGLVHGLEHAVAPGDHRQPRRLHRALGLGLVAHAPDHHRVGADEREAARLADLDEMRVLGEESIAG